MQVAMSVHDGQKVIEGIRTMNGDDTIELSLI